MNKQKGKQKERMVCFCYSVSEPVIINAIEQGAETLMDIRRDTYASTGCAGCTAEVKKLLDKHVPRVRAAKNVKKEPESGSGT